MLSSHGCATCRSRRIRCDQSLPTCLRCVRAKRLCIMHGDDPTSKRLPVTPAGRGKGRIGRRPSSSSRTIQPPPTIPQSLSPAPDPTQRKEAFFQWQKGKDPWMRNAIDHFLSNFVFNAEDLSLLGGGSGIEVFDIVPAETGPGRAVIDVLDVLVCGLLIVRAASMQTMDGRREQHVKYRLAMGALRESILLYPNTRTLLAPIFLFALYEMIVNTATNDKTWQIHLDGLLAMLQENRHSTTKGDDSNLIAAREFAQSERNCHRDDLQEFLQSRPLLDDVEKAWLLVDISKLRLRKFIATMDRFRTLSRGSNSTCFRKLDVEKLRVTVKQIQRDHLLVRELIPKEYHPTRVSKAHSSWSPASILPPYYCGYYEETYSNNLLCAKWNEYRAMLLITSDFLLKSGQFLYSGTSRPNTRETTALSRTMKEAVDGICASVAYYYYYYDNSRANNIKSFAVFSYPNACEGESIEGNRDLVSLSMTTMDALALAWSLHCAIAMHHVIAEDQGNWMKQVLYDTGSRMRIPKAMALASAPETFSYSDVLAGMTLLGSGVLRIE